MAILLSASTIATRLKATACRVEAIAIRLEAIATRLEAIATGASTMAPLYFGTLDACSHDSHDSIALGARPLRE